MPTPLRNVRVPEDVWQAAMARAESEGTSVSAVVVAALRRYAKGARGDRRKASEGERR